jgi:hypothetical protein
MVSLKGPKFRLLFQRLLDEEVADIENPACCPKALALHVSF